MNGKMLILLLLVSISSSFGLKGPSEGPIVYVRAGTTATLKCYLDLVKETFDGFYDGLGQKIDAAYMDDKYKVKFLESKKAYFLDIKNATQKDMGEYSCRILSKESIAYRLFLEPSINMISNRQTLFIGSNKVVQVKVDGSSLPDITWQRFKDFKFVDVAKYDSKKRYMIQGKDEYDISKFTGSLTIRKLDSSYSGEYKIKIVAKSMMEKKITVTVQERAKITRDTARSKYLQGNNHVIYCSARGIPQPKITFLSHLHQKIRTEPSIKETGNRIDATLKLTTNHSYVVCNASNKHAVDTVNIGLGRRRNRFTEINKNVTIYGSTAQDKRLALIVISSGGGGGLILICAITFCIWRSCRRKKAARRGDFELEDPAKKRNEKKDKASRDGESSEREHYRRKHRGELNRFHKERGMERYTKEPLKHPVLTVGSQEISDRTRRGDVPTRNHNESGQNAGRIRQNEEEGTNRRAAMGRSGDHRRGKPNGRSPRSKNNRGESEVPAARRKDEVQSSSERRERSAHHGAQSTRRVQRLPQSRKF